MTLTRRRWQAEALPLALAALTPERRGVIRAATGAGKSILQATLLKEALPLLADDEHVVVTVPSQQLVEQLAGTLRAHLGEDQVGRYYASHKELRRVIVTCHPSLYRHADPAPYCADCHPYPGDVHLTGGRAVTERQRLYAHAVAGAEGCAHQEHVTVAIPCATSGLATLGLRVGLWLADECHKTEVDSVLNWALKAQPRLRLGFTATPWRGSERSQISSFEEVLYDYGPGHAIDDGVLHLPACVTPDATTAGLPLPEAVTELVRAHLARHPGPGVISTRTITECEELAAHLAAEGIRALPIHSRQDRATQEARITALRTGELDCLTYVSLLCEGVDFPWLEWLCLARPGTSRVRFPQEIGRVMRTCKGKHAAYVLDPLGVYLNADFESEIRLGDYEATASLPSEEEAPDAPPPPPKALAAIEVSELEVWLKITHKRGVLKRAFEATPKGTWTQRPVSARQLTKLDAQARSIASRTAALDPRDLTLLRGCYARRAQLTCGSASKLIDIFGHIRLRGSLPA
jgi:superfamily II DNA or RNA helicase